MAHIEKYQAHALGGMLGHYRRKAELEHGFERENIDPARTALNYNLRERPDPLGFINGRIASLHLKRAPRKDAVRMIDTVVSLPRSYTGDAREFFEAVEATLSDIFGTDNCVGAWVHMDEAQPHMHYASVPVTEDGRLSAKSLVSRRFLQQLHGQLEAGVCARLGIDRAGLTLTEDERERRAGEYVGLDEYKAAKAAAAAKEATAAELDEVIAGKRHQLDDLDRQIEQAQADLSDAQSEYNALRAAFETLAAEIRDYIREWLTEPYKAFREWAKSWGREAAEEEVEQRATSLADRARQSAAAADAWNQNRSGSSSRDWER